MTQDPDSTKDTMDSDSSDTEFAEFSKWGERLYTARRETIQSEEVSLSETNETLTMGEKTIVDEMESSLPLSLVGVGAGRVVFTRTDSEEQVVKFARWGDNKIFDGKEQNGWEVRLWDTLVEQEIDEPLLPILSSCDDLLWVVQPNVTPLAESSLSDDESVEIASTLRSTLMPLGDYVEISEIAVPNVGLWNGEPYLFDYGRPPGIDATEI